MVFTRNGGGGKKGGWSKGRRGEGGGWREGGAEGRACGWREGEKADFCAQF